MRILQKLSCSVIALVLFASLTAWGAQPRARTLHGVIQSVNSETRMLTFTPEKSSKTEVFLWKAQTKFLENGRFVDPSSLKDARVEIRYRSPFFGQKFVTKVIWTNPSEKSHSPK